MLWRGVHPAKTYLLQVNGQVYKVKGQDYFMKVYELLKSYGS